MCLPQKNQAIHGEIMDLLPRELGASAELVHRDLLLHRTLLPRVAQNRSSVVFACARRRHLLEGLLRERRYAEAVDLSYALDPFKTEAWLPSDCAADEPYIGHADVLVKVETWSNDRLSRRVRRKATATVKIKEQESVLRLLSKGVRFTSSTLGAPVVGFRLADSFVALESPMRCYQTTEGSLFCHGGGDNNTVHFDNANEAVKASRSMLVNATRTGRNLAKSRLAVKSGPHHEAARWRHSRIDDIQTNHVVGAKSILFIPLCASDEDDCDHAYDYGLIASNYGGDLEAYLSDVMSVTNQFMHKNSWGLVSFFPTFLPIQRVAYSKASCGDYDGLGYYLSSNDGTFDVLAYESAANSGVFVEDYDYNVVVVPFCNGLGWSGVGWVGYPGIALNLIGTNYDQSLAHELGHNFGANHASFANDDRSRGSVAWWDDSYGDNSQTWVEYGNPFSVRSVSKNSN